MTNPYDPAKVDELLAELEAALVNISIHTNVPEICIRLIKARDALSPPAPKKEYVLPEEMTGLVHAIFYKLALSGGSLFQAYSAVREATAREVQPVKTIPAGSEWTDADLDKLKLAWAAAPEGPWAVRWKPILIAVIDKIIEMKLT